MIQIFLLLSLCKKISCANILINCELKIGKDFMSENTGENLYLGDLFKPFVRNFSEPCRVVVPEVPLH